MQGLDAAPDNIGHRWAGRHASWRLWLESCCWRLGQLLVTGPADTQHTMCIKSRNLSVASQYQSFNSKGAHCVQYMMAGATPDLHSMHITLYSTVDAASEMHCDVWRSQTSKGNKRMPEQFTFVI